MGNYLLSDHFSLFCREHNLSEIWDGLLGFSRDKPELYGGDIIRDAFFQLLQHICRGRRKEFLEILIGLLADYSKISLKSNLVPTIKQDLIRPGYSLKEVEVMISTMDV
jgi:hypothetical protein